MLRPQFHPSSTQARIVKLVASFGLVLFVATLWFTDLSGYLRSTYNPLDTFVDPLGEAQHTAMNTGAAYTPVAAQNDDELASFLRTNKADFVKALDEGSSLQGWVIVMGALATLSSQYKNLL